MALRKRTMKVVTIEDVSIYADEVPESCVLVDDQTDFSMVYNYESFPENPTENSIHELVMYYKDNKQIFDQYNDKEVDLPEWLYIAEFFKRHNCFGSPCVQKALENMQQLENFFLSGIPEPVSSPANTVIPWTKASLNPAVQPAVIGEVLLLLAHLHYDCVRTNEKLRQEVDMSKYTLSQINEMGEKKLRIMAAAVQKEHNKFHQKNLPSFMNSRYIQRISRACNRKMAIAKNYSRLLIEDIEFATIQIPLVEEKIQMEKVKIDKIAAAAEEATAALNQTIQCLNITILKHMKAKNLTEIERQQIKKTIKDFLAELENVKKAVMISEENNIQLKKDIVDIKQQIRDHDEIKTVLEVKIDNYKSTQQILNMEYKELSQTLSAQLKLNNQIRQENNKLKRVVESKHLELTKDLEKLDLEQEDLKAELQTMKTSNAELSTKLKTLDEEIETCHTNKNLNEKALNRASYEIIKTQNQIVLANDELKRFQDLNSKFNVTFNLEEKKILENERKIKELLADIMIKVDEEEVKYKRLSVEVEEAREDLMSIKQDYKTEKDSLLKDEHESIMVVNVLDDKLEKLNLLKSRKEQVLEDLIQKQQKLQERFKERIRDENMYMERLNPYTQMLNESVYFLNKKEVEIIDMENSMISELKTMEQQKNAFISVSNKLKGNIRKNKTAMMNITAQLKKVEVASADSLNRLTETQDRVNLLYNQHKDLQKERRNVLKELIELKQNHLKENTDLASRYRWHENHHLYLQYCYSQKSDRNLHIEQTLKDLRQLLSMQVKVHQNLQSYFQYRGMYNTQELLQLQHKSNLNQKKAHDLKRSIDNNIESMSSYIDHAIAESIQRSVRIKEKRQQLPKITTTISG